MVQLDGGDSLRSVNKVIKKISTFSLGEVKKKRKKKCQEFVVILFRFCKNGAQLVDPFV